MTRPQSVPDDTIEIQNNQAVITKFVNGSKPIGTSLIRRIIASDKVLTVIATTNGSNVVADNWSNASNGSGSDAILRFNYATFESVLTRYSNGSHKYNIMPKEIEMGHELIHSLRAMNGNTKPLNQMGTYAYTTPKGKVLTETWRQEELETTGISYYQGYNYKGNPVNAWTWETTENALRRENWRNNNYNPRVRYMVPSKTGS